MAGNSDEPREVFEEFYGCGHSTVVTNALFWPRQSLVLINIKVIHKDHDDYATFPRMHVAYTPSEAQRMAIAEADAIIKNVDQLLTDYEEAFNVQQTTSNDQTQRDSECDNA